MSIKHVMVDLETMGTRPTSAIVSIGAVEFDPYTPGAVGERFYKAIDLESSMAAGLTVDAGTIGWWVQQSQEAREALLKEPVSLRSALADFRLWCLGSKGMRLWCHGPSFDAVILEHAFGLLSITKPWRYNDARDTRTVYEMAGIDIRQEQREGVYHNALDDALFQAKMVQKAYERLGVMARKEAA